METIISRGLIAELGGKVVTNFETGVEEIVVTPNAQTSISSIQNGAFENEDDPNLNADSQEIDEEENFLCSIEKKQEEAEIEDAISHPNQPHRTEEAPTLLRGALKEGLVKADDSETEEDEKKDAGIEQSKGEVHEHHTHSRSSQLQFLLDKAQEYSNFIADDLIELQKSMAEEAQRKATAVTGKKRKGEKESGKSSSKKVKGVNGVANLKKAQDQHDASLKSAITRPIFTRPPNLNPDCQLKDYQLEGVRWLASLYGMLLGILF